MPVPPGAQVPPDSCASFVRRLHRRSGERQASAPRKRRFVCRSGRLNVAIFSDDAFFLIAGPCVLEDDKLNLSVAEALAKVSSKIPGGIVYKASFDKANRSNV